MHKHSLDQWQQSHDFLSSTRQNESRTRHVVLLTLVMMVAEIATGWLYGSMALLADGWHMGTHAAALGITLFAYRYARVHREDQRYSFGTGKVKVLGGYTSAVVLVLVAVLMIWESVHRLLVPQAIHFDESIGVAVLGLVVNIISVFLLKDDHHHGHHHGHHHDHNLRAAYLHVLTDALTSVLAIVALLLGKMVGWNWMDPLMGMVGAVVIIHWTYGLLRETTSILLDSAKDMDKVEELRAAIEEDGDSIVADLHLWRIEAEQYALICALVTHDPQEPEHYKKRIREVLGGGHITVEVNPCKTEAVVSLAQ